MKTIKILLTLPVAIVFAVSCKPEKENTKEDLNVLRAANVRMEIKNQKKTTKAAIVGDSASVKRLARWGYEIRFRNTDGADYLPENLVGNQNGRPFEGNDEFRRDTINCIYIFRNTIVCDYGRFEWNEEGRYQYGVPGTEEPGWLMWSADHVFVGYYDTVKNCYRDADISFTDPRYEFPEINCRVDTLGYIPQSQIRANNPRLLQLFKEGKYGEMVEIMRTGYTIYTCTGEEYRELVKQGRN